MAGLLKELRKTSEPAAALHLVTVILLQRATDCAFRCGDDPFHLQLPVSFHRLRFSFAAADASIDGYCVSAVLSGGDRLCLL